MTPILAAAADLLLRWNERDRRYGRPRPDGVADLVWGNRADELADLEDDARAVGSVNALHRSDTWRQLRASLEGWRR